MKKRHFLGALLGLIGAFAIQSTSLAQTKPIRVGVTGGPHAEIFELVKEEAAKQGLKLELVVFNDYVIPNAALNSGDIDMNSYQHQPFLDNANQQRKYKLQSIAKTVTFPIGLYSKKIKSLAELKDGATIAIPNDPTNGGRALLLLEKHGLLTLRKGAGLTATPLDIESNPRKFKVMPLVAEQLPRTLTQVDLAAINTNFAMSNGIQPQSAIVIEDKNSPYSNIIAVRASEVNRPEFAQIVKIYHSDKVKQFVNEKYKGAIIANW